MLATLGLRQSRTGQDREAKLGHLPGARDLPSLLSLSCIRSTRNDVQGSLTVGLSGKRSVCPGMAG